ncbi:MAG: FUSC family protein [Candidatus Dormiibacterota bacterium]
MTAAAPPVPAHRSAWSRAVGWVSAKDPGFLAVKRSVRAAVVMPAAFALAHLLFPDSAQVGLFAAFGSFALILFSDFRGRPRTRLISYLGVFLVGSFFITLGTLASTQRVVAVVAMAIVAFAVLFAGVVSPQAATASTAVLLTFVLPVAIAQPIESLGPRLLGWALAGAFCIPASMVVWPTPWRDDLRRRLSATVSAVAKLVAARAQGGADPKVTASVTAELSRLRAQFRATPYPPISAAAGAVALATLMGRVEWLAGYPALVGNEAQAPEPEADRELLGQVAETLRLSSSLICDGHGYPVDDREAVKTVQESTRRLQQLIGTELDAQVSSLIEPVVAGRRLGLLPSTAPSLPAFHARGLAIAAELVADASLEAAGAEPVADSRRGMAGRRSWRQFWQQFRSYLSLDSVWFRNALRGATALALAVAVVEVTNVEHGFWVVLGTLSVLRSNALGTGSTALRAVGGTALGFVVGAAIMIGVGSHLVVLWVLLPLAVLVAGAAPSMISFAAGQAGFSVVVIILFNIIVPAGWTVGLTRVEDVAIGAAVSVAVGLLFWPRGATAALGRALSDAFVESSGYLADAVDRLTARSGEVDTRPGQRAADTAYLRLDDAFRQFLTERGAKVLPVETLAKLFTGTNRIRLAGYTLAAIPESTPDPGRAELESVAIAGAVLRDSYAASHRWYQEFAEVLADRRGSLDPPPAVAETVHDVLQGALSDAQAQGRDDQLRATLQMLWAVELLEVQHQVQADLAESANLFARRKHESRAI